MRDLGAVVLAQALLVAGGQAHLAEGGAIGPQPVGGDHGRREALLPEQLAHQLAGGVLVPPALHQDVQHLALVVHRPPEMHPLAADVHGHLVEVPTRAGLRPALPEPPGDGRPELQHPAPDRLVGHLEPALGQQVLDVAEAEGEAQVQILCGWSAADLIGDGGQATAFMEASDVCPNRPPAPKK